jgi:hypothetical protein
MTGLRGRLFVRSFVQSNYIHRTEYGVVVVVLCTNKTKQLESGFGEDGTKEEKLKLGLSSGGYIRSST